MILTIRFAVTQHYKDLWSTSSNADLLTHFAFSRRPIHLLCALFSYSSKLSKISRMAKPPALMALSFIVHFGLGDGIVAAFLSIESCASPQLELYLSLLYSEK